MVKVLDVLTYPHPILRTVCKPVPQLTDEITDHVDSMIETMYYHVGTVGLAASQVNILKRIIVLDISAKTTQQDLKVLINPEIIYQSRYKYCREGCLSFPDYLMDIKRATKIVVKARDAKWEDIEFEAKSFEAVVIQHEIDHLNGILFIDKVDGAKTSVIRRQLYEDLFMNEELS